MLAIIMTEAEKLKRYAVLKAGVIIVILSGVFSFSPVLANDGVREDFPIIMNNILEYNCIYFFPAMIILIGGFIARREYMEDTLKNILTVPVSIRKLLLGKIFMLFFLTIFFSILSGLLGIFLCCAAGLSNITFPLIIEWTARIVLGNIFLFVALLPITIIATLSVDAVYACTAAGFVCGFLAIIEWAPMNYYPVKAVLILFDPQCGVGYDFVHYSKAGAGFTLFIVFCISVILFAALRPTNKLDRVKPLKKVVRAKGW